MLGHILNLRNFIQLYVKYCSFFFTKYETVNFRFGSKEDQNCSNFGMWLVIIGLMQILRSVTATIHLSHDHSIYSVLSAVTTRNVLVDTLSE